MAPKNGLAVSSAASTTSSSSVEYADSGRACDSVLCSHPDCWAPKQRLSWGESKIVLKETDEQQRRKKRTKGGAYLGSTTNAIPSHSGGGKKLHAQSTVKRLELRYFKKMKIE